MTKQLVIDEIAKAQGMSAADAKRALDATTNGIRSVLNTAGEVTIPGFGTLKREMSKRTSGRNPRTGETIAIIPRPVAKFKASKGLLG